MQNAEWAVDTSGKRSRHPAEFTGDCVGATIGRPQTLKIFEL